MKALLTFCLLTVIISQGYSQDTLRYVDYKLPPEQFSMWDSIQENWFKETYWNCLKAHKLKMTCAGCHSIFARVQFYINSEGKISQYKVIQSRSCGGEMSKELLDCFLKPYLEIIFPAELRNMEIETRLGTGLSC